MANKQVVPSLTVYEVNQEYEDLLQILRRMRLIEQYDPSNLRLRYRDSVWTLPPSRSLTELSNSELARLTKMMKEILEVVVERTRELLAGHGSSDMNKDGAYF